LSKFEVYSLNVFDKRDEKEVWGYYTKLGSVSMWLYCYPWGNGFHATALGVFYFSEDAASSLS